MNAQAQTQQVIASLPLTEIHLDFENTRSKIQPDALESLKASISENGLLQPIVVTPRESGEGYALVAGFTRHKAISELGYDSIAVTVVEGNPTQIAEMHAAENLTRTDLSLTGSVTAIRRLATKLGNDYSEIAKRLSLTKKQLDDRLALSYCSPKVLEYLDDGKIKLGHAVLLSSFTEAVQDKSLDKIIGEGWTVDTLRERVGKARLKLELGIFDKSACNGCQHNSDTLAQATLFDEEVVKGICSNSSCFGAKQTAALANKREELVENYGTLLDYSKTDQSLIRLVDATVLGDSQYTNCQTCPNNCAIMDDRLTSPAIGSVREQVCNDSSCFDKHATAFVQASAPQPESTSEAQVATDATTDAPDSVEPPKAKTETTFMLEDAKMGNKQGEAADLQLAQYVRDSFPLSPEEQLKITYLAAVSLTGHISNRELDQIDGKSEAEVYALIKEKLTRFFEGADSRTETGSNTPRGILHALATHRPDAHAEIVASWTTEALDDYPKYHIAAICKEAGFDVAYNEAKGDEKAFDTLIKASKNEFLRDIKGTEFEGWASYAPAAYIARFIKQPSMQTAE